MPLCILYDILESKAGVIMKNDFKTKLFSKIKASINAKFMITFFLLLILPFTILTNLFVYRFQSLLTDNEREYVNNKIDFSKDQLDKMLQDMNGIIASLIMNYNVMDILSGNTAVLSYEWFKEYKSLQNLLQSLASNSDFNYQITILDANNKLYQSGIAYNSYLTLSSPLAKNVIDGNTLLVNRVLDGYDSNQVITYGRAIWNNGRFLGIILVDVTFAHLNKTLNLIPEADTCLYIVQDNDKILYSTTPAVSSVTAPPPLKEALASGSSSLTMNNKKYLLMKKTVPKHNLTVLALVSKNAVFRESSAIFRQFIIIFSLIIAGTVFGIILLTTHLSKNLIRLNDQVSRFGNNIASTISVKVSSDDEVGQLAKGFITMSQRIKNLLEQIKTSEQNKRKLEFQALQAQVNPHMIYNTLNTITYLAQLQNVPNIEEVSSSFAALLHLISNSKGEYITVGEELEYVKAYISIKKYNVICDIRTDVRLENQAEDCRILKLLLQPIVENAIVHGFANFTGDGILTIRINREDSRIEIDIIDNGNGMDEETVKQILSGEKENKNNFTSIGISNIMKRLQLQYGDGSVFRITSSLHGGTAVHIEYPAGPEPS